MQSLVSSTPARAKSSVILLPRCWDCDATPAGSMKILVPFKSVLDPNDAAFAGAAVSVPKSVINPFDEIAIEEALRIREHGEATEIVGVTIGASAVDEQIRAALAMGVDRAIRIDDSRALDPYAVA